MSPKIRISINPKTLALFFLFLGVSISITACGSNTNTDRRIPPESGPTPLPTAIVAEKPTYTVNRGTVSYEINFNGRIAPIFEDVLAFPLDGTISQVYVTRGDLINTGDIIAELDTSVQEEELSLAQTSLEIAQTRLDTRESELATNRRRAEIDFELAQVALDFVSATASIPPTLDEQYEIDRLTLLLELAELNLSQFQASVDPGLVADVQQAELRVAELEEEIAAAQISASFDGVIISLNMDPGKSIFAGEVVGVLAIVDQIEITAKLGSGELEQLFEEMVVSIEPGSRRGDPMDGNLYRLPYPYGSGGNIEITDDDMTIRISFNDMNAALDEYTLGERVSLTITITEREDVLWLPAQAIRDFNGRKFVVIQDQDVQQRVDVTLGIVGNGRAEIVEGLEEGQIIIGQ